MFETGIVPLVVSNIPENSRVSELYSGVGVLGLNAAASARASEVLCSDTNEFVDEVFDSCAESLPIVSN
jgi:16S rRNA G966 N2-methylase RsmD